MHPSPVREAGGGVCEEPLENLHRGGLSQRLLHPGGEGVRDEDAIRNGADEIDMVMDIGLAKSGDWEGVLEEIKAVKASCNGHILKVIVEACQLTQEEKIAACRVVSMSGADFIKTSTGFASGGATVEDVSLFRDHISPDVRIKAAGGIRTFEQAQALLEAGADRIGASALVALYRQEG